MKFRNENIGNEYSLDAYKTIGPGLATDIYAVNNTFNRNILQYIRNRGVLVDFLGHLKQTARVVTLNDMCSIKSRENMAKVTQKELVTVGAEADDDTYLKMPNFLVALNCLTGLCYCSIVGRSGDRKSFLCTKNPAILNIFIEEYGAYYLRSEIEKKRKQLSIAQTEVENKYLNVVRMYPENNGKVVLRTARIYPNSKNTFLAPMFAVGNYTDCIVSNLKRNLCKITCNSNNGRIQLTSTLNPSLLQKYSRVSAQFLNECVYSENDMLELNIFNLTDQRFYTINLLNVTALQKFSS